MLSEDSQKKHKGKENEQPKKFLPMIISLIALLFGPLSTLAGEKPLVLQELNWFDVQEYLKGNAVHRINHKTGSTAVQFIEAWKEAENHP